MTKRWCSDWEISKTLTRTGEFVLIDELLRAEQILGDCLQYVLSSSERTGA